VLKSIRFLLPVLLTTLPLPAVADQAQHLTHRPIQSRLAQAADITSGKGFSAKLPPHISTLLRLSNEQECPVKQSVTRSGSVIQGLDVSVANKNDIILFVVDESANDQTLYLTSPDGTLRRVVQVKGGVGNEIRVTDKERKAFQQEKQFWVDRLVPAGKAPSNPPK
jgi:hypothetical protein